MKSNKLKPFLAGVGILAIGVVGLITLIALRPEPPRVETTVAVPVVEAVQPEMRQGALQVRGNGSVRPTREISLVAEVAGKVVWTSPAMKTGGYFQVGQALVRIDPADYENAVAMAEAEVAQRRYELLLSQREAELAREEWQRSQRFTGIDQPPSTDQGSLALKEPQLKLADALLKSAEARLSDARTRLGRTTITAPYNGRIRTENVDAGQYVGPGTMVGSAYSTDAVEIAVPLTTQDAALIDGLWSAGRTGGRIEATVYADFGGTTQSWEGYVDRTEGALDTATRTVSVVVRVDRPYDAGERPLLVGMFTTVEIEGRELDRYYSLPREALREGNEVCVVRDGRLSFTPLEVIQEADGQVYVQGLDGAEQVVTSNLAVVTDGMAVRLSNGQ
jgi:RND family efflux transporter MFP subunit